MSRYPDTDPDAALTGEEQDLLSSSLAVDDAELPDAVREHMLAVVTGADDTDRTPRPTAATPPSTRRPRWAPRGKADPAVHDHGDDPGFDGGDAGPRTRGPRRRRWDGGAV